MAIIASLRTALTSSGIISGIGFAIARIIGFDNIKNIPFALEVGQRLFQLVGMDGSEINFELVENLSTSSRGSGGFGSTGK